MSRQERREVALDEYRSDTWPAASVGDAEGLVQVEATNVGAVIARSSKTDLSVQIGAIEIDLTAVGMHDVASVANARFEYAVG